MKPALLVHLVFHPDSEASRELSREIHHALNGDPVVPGLRVPTSFCPTIDGDPPSGLGLDQAERSFVVVLADAKLDIEEDWCSFVADVWSSCQETAHRCVPIQLGETAWPLDDRLSGTNFVRAFAEPEESRTDFVVRRIVIELCRFLHGDDAGETDTAGAPTTVFLSHTKMDLANEPFVVEAIKQKLGPDQPIKTWFDSGDIAGGSEFERKIAAGVQDSSLLCVLTDNYASREWCRREVLLAKRNNRPIVVVDALSSHEVRSFPYMGNLPVLRWTGDPQAAIDLVLKETLRDLYARVVLRRHEVPGDVVYTRPPELLDAVGQPPGTTILYPDPPLGIEESETLALAGIQIATPVQRVSHGQGLNGLRVALSMSESDDLSRFGFDGLHLSSTMLELARHLLIEGATLVYGGHLGDAGYTQQLTELVHAHNALPGVDPVDRLENFVGWPLPLSDDLRSRYKRVAKLVPVPRPADVGEDLHPDFVEEPVEFFAAGVSPVHRYAWARGMTAMREAETATVVVRVALGGTIGPTTKRLPDGTSELSWYMSRIPGVLEEVMISARAEQPVFLLGAFGGVPALVMDIIEGRDRPDATWDFHQGAPGASEMRDLYEARGQEWWDYPDMIAFLQERGLEGLNPLLSTDEHRELFHARQPEAMLEILMEGLGRVL